MLVGCSVVDSARIAEYPGIHAALGLWPYAPWIPTSWFRVDIELERPASRDPQGADVEVPQVSRRTIAVRVLKPVGTHTVVVTASALIVAGDRQERRVGLVWA